SNSKVCQKITLGNVGHRSLENQARGFCCKLCIWRGKEYVVAPQAMRLVAPRRTGRQLTVPALYHALPEKYGNRRKRAASTVSADAARSCQKGAVSLVGVRGFEPPAPSSRS